MIEEFAVPKWVRLLIRMTGHHYRRSTAVGVPRVPPTEATAGLHDDGAPATAADTTASAPETADAASSHEVAGAFVDVRTAEATPSTVIGTATSDASPVDQATPTAPIDADEDRLTRSFVAAAQALSDRVQGLVVVPGRPGAVRTESPTARQTKSTAAAETAGAERPTTAIAADAVTPTPVADNIEPPADADLSPTTDADAPSAIDPTTDDASAIGSAAAVISAVAASPTGETTAADDSSPVEQSAAVTVSVEPASEPTEAVVTDTITLPAPAATVLAGAVLAGESVGVATAAGEALPTAMRVGLSAMAASVAEPRQSLPVRRVSSVEVESMPTPDSSAPPDSDASEVSSADASTLTEQTPTAFKSDAPTPDELTPAVLTPDQPLQESPVADAVADADITLHRPAPQESTDPSPAPEVDASPLSEDSAEVTDVPPDVAAAAMPLPRETENVVAAAVATAAVPEADIVPSTPVEATEPVGESDTSGATQASRLVEAAESDKLAADDTVVEPIATSAANTLAEARPAAAPAAVAAPLSAVEVMKKAAASVLAPAVRDEYNRTNLDYRRPMPRPKVHGLVIDGHCHLLARRHADAWFEAADHYGFFGFITQTPLEEAAALHRDWGHRLRFVAVPQWGDTSPAWADNWRRRIDAFYNLGARLAKFHASPGNMLMRGHRLDEPVFEPLLNEVRDRGMCIMTHIGDPDTWYAARYTDTARFGTRDDHYAMWERLLERYRGTPWLGAHLGGNPEDLPRLQRLLDRFPDLVLDCSATRWMVREISARREPAREFFIRNQDRILFGSDQVSGDDRGFDFLASRIWCHRKLWETAYTGESPIIDPDVPADQQPVLRGLALPDSVLQKLYHDNAQRLLGRVDAAFAE